MKEAEADPAVHAVILTGSGSSFCSGLDIKALRDPGWDPLAWNGTVATLLEASVPVIAAVNGVASTAGLGLMLSCDFAIASEAATFVDLHAKLGLISASGSASLLAERIGIARARVRAMISTHDRGRRGTLAEHLRIEVEAAARWANRKQ